MKRVVWTGVRAVLAVAVFLVLFLLYSLLFPAWWIHYGNEPTPMPSLGFLAEVLAGLIAVAFIPIWLWDSRHRV